MTGKNYKNRKERGLEDIYRILERIYREIGEGRRTRLPIGYKGVLRSPIKQYPPIHQLQQRTEQRSQTQRQYQPSAVKPWTEPRHYEAKERIVYDPEMKSLLEKIEKHLRTGFENLNKEDDIDDLDVEQLIKKLEENYDPKILEKFLEKGLEEINKAEPEPKLYEMEWERDGIKKKEEIENEECKEIEEIISFKDNESEDSKQIYERVEQLDINLDELVEQTDVEKEAERLQEQTIESKIIEPVETKSDLLTQQDSQDLSRLEAELLQSEPESEPKIEESEVEEIGED